MAMVDLNKVRQVLIERLLTTTGFPSTNLINYENHPFIPPDPLPPTIWIREHFLLGYEKKVATMTVEAIGRAQYDVIFPLGGGTEAPEDLSKTIVGNFEPGLRIDSQSIQVHIDQCEQNAGRAFDTVWWLIPVSVSWRTYATTAN